MVRVPCLWRPLTFDPVALRARFQEGESCLSREVVAGRATGPTALPTAQCSLQGPRSRGDGAGASRSHGAHTQGADGHGHTEAAGGARAGTAQEGDLLGRCSPRLGSLSVRWVISGSPRAL